MGWFKINDDIKDQALKNYERANRELKKTGERGSEAAQALFLHRIEALKAIEAAERKLIKRHDFDIDNIRKIADAKAKIRQFAEAIQIGNEDVDSSDVSFSFSEFGKKAMIAFSTAFGSAATDSAISTISGTTTIEDRTIAWLSGLSGGAVAAGSAFLILTGPSGWALGAAAINKTTALKRKNAKIAQQANEAADSLDRIKKKVEKSIDRINLCRKEIAEGIGALNSLMKGIPIDNGQVKYNDEEIVKTIENLCTNINKKFTI